MAVVVLAGRAGAALGSEPLAAPGRGPSVTRYVVTAATRSGRRRTTWRRTPTREVVDALIDARGNGPLMPGEVLRWQR